MNSNISVPNYIEEFLKENGLTIDDLFSGNAKRKLNYNTVHKKSKKKKRKNKR